MPELRFDTNYGTIRMLLYDAWAPQNAGQVARLAESGFYDDTIIHRVADDFVIQGGDPSGTGQFGSGSTVPLEYDERLHYAAGSVGMARDTDEDSGDSQWFIAETPQPHLTKPSGATGDVFGTYTLFAQTFEGLDVVRSIAAVTTLPGADRPLMDVVVEQANLLPPPSDLDAMNAVRAVSEPFPWTLGDGFLDAPMWVVSGHPARVLAHDVQDTGESFDPRGTQWTLAGHQPVAPDWVETIDLGTWEATVVFPAAGPWTLETPGCAEACGSQTLEVLPWHDAYF